MHTMDLETSGKTVLFIIWIELKHAAEGATI
jgi:hypothetical protein